MRDYNPFESMAFTYDRCFLCGDILTADSRSEEHVYPRWLQRKFDLWDQEIYLLNGTTIPYRQLKIPCCKKCNNEYLNKLVEKPIEEAFRGGYEEFKKLDRKIIFQWLTKLSYGMLFKELSLMLDRGDPTIGRIIDAEQLKEFKILYSFLRSILHETTFNEPKPWSILLFNIKDDSKFKYYAYDHVFGNCFFMRANEIGIISNLQDGSYQQEFFYEHMKVFLKTPLVDIQFREICAKFFYKNTLMIKSPTFLTLVPSKTNNHMDVITTQPGGNVFADWNQYEYAKILEKYLAPYGIPFEKIYYEGDKVSSYLYNADGTIKQLTR